MRGVDADTWLVAAAAETIALEEAVRDGDWEAAASADARLRRALTEGVAGGREPGEEASSPSPEPDPRLAEIARRHTAALESALSARARLLEAGVSLAASRQGAGRYLEVAGAD